MNRVLGGDEHGGGWTEINRVEVKGVEAGDEQGEVWTEINRVEV